MRDNVIENVHTDKDFFVADGRTLKNIKDLHGALETMDDQTFAHHVTPHKNDFARWVEHALGLDVLAKKLEGSGSRKKAHKAVGSHLHSDILNHAKQGAELDFTVQSRKYGITMAALAGILLIVLFGTTTQAGFTGAFAGPGAGMTYLGIGGMAICIGVLVLAIKMTKW